MPAEMDAYIGDTLRQYQERMQDVIECCRRESEFYWEQNREEYARVSARSGELMGKWLSKKCSSEEHDEWSAADKRLSEISGQDPANALNSRLAEIVREHDQVLDVYSRNIASVLSDAPVHVGQHRPKVEKPARA